MTPADSIARAAAKRLDPAVSGDLPLAVEKALLAPGGPPQDFVTLTDLATMAGVIVLAGQTAWQIHRDLTPKPSAEALARQVRIKLREKGVAAEVIDQVADIVAEEAVKAGVPPRPALSRP